MGEDGLFWHFNGPHLGPSHDSRVAINSGIYDLLDDFAIDANGNAYYVVGDSA
jgi:hypothetical protein